MLDADIFCGVARVLGVIINPRSPIRSRSDRTPDPYTIPDPRSLIQSFRILIEISPMILQPSANLGQNPRPISAGVRYNPCGILINPCSILGNPNQIVVQSSTIRADP